MTARLRLLKWHMLKRRPTDPPFPRKNLEAGLRTGAALEADLVSTADGHFVRIHNLTLDRETTRTGAAAARTRDQMRHLSAYLVLAGLDAGVNLVERVCREGAELDAWTIDAVRPHIRDDLRRLVAAGCQQITTDDPDALLPILQEVA